MVRQTALPKCLVLMKVRNAIFVGLHWCIAVSTITYRALQWISIKKSERDSLICYELLSVAKGEKTYVNLRIYLHQ